MAQGIKTLCPEKRSTIPFAQNPTEFSCDQSSPVLSCFAFVNFKKSSDNLRKTTQLGS